MFLAAPTRDGFVDTSRALQDSIGDIRQPLAGMKEFQLVEKRAGADLVLTVIARGVGSEEYGRRLIYTEYYKNAVLTNTLMVAKTYWVATMMEVGSYQKEFTGASTNSGVQSMGAWADCARQLAGDLQSWTVANAAHLIERRFKVP